MKVCQRCGATYPDSFSFCGFDADPLIEEVPADPLLGHAVDNRYRLQCLIGKGGFGAVYRALDDRRRRDVAVKVLSGALSAEPAHVQRFKREVCLLAGLKHPHLVDVFDYGHDERAGYFLVMEYLSGEGLGSRLERAGSLPILDVYTITRQTAAALGAAHQQGIIHRDLKPSNIFLARESEAPMGYTVRLLDFGLAKVVVGDQDVTQTVGRHMTTEAGVVFGTPLTISPEAAQGLPLTPRADLYSLGVVLFEMLTGRPPFEAPSGDAVMRKKVYERPPAPSTMPDAGWIPPELDAVVLSLLATAPADQPEGAAQVIDALEQMRIQVEEAWTLHHLVSPRHRQAAPREAGAGGPGAGAVAGAAPLVLTVDDDPSIRALLRLIIQGAGCRCAEAPGGAQALAWLRENPPPDAILVDVLMPGMDGMSLLQEIRRLGHAGPVIVCSAFRAAEIRAQVEALGAMRVINKARDLHTLPAVLAALGLGPTPAEERAR